MCNCQNNSKPVNTTTLIFNGIKTAAKSLLPNYSEAIDTYSEISEIMNLLNKENKEIGIQEFELIKEELLAAKEKLEISKERLETCISCGYKEKINTPVVLGAKMYLESIIGIDRYQELNKMINGFTVFDFACSSCGCPIVALSFANREHCFANKWNR